jgi:NitT/TauT family transport system substrate-binding protein
VASGRAQFASAGSYSEVIQQSTGGAKFAVVTDDGKQSINVLLVKPDAGVNQLADLKGKTIGVLGAMPQSVTAMLVKAGLKDGRDYHTVLLDGFDPVAHFQQQIAGRPASAPTSPASWNGAGVPFTMFDPSAEGIPARSD